MSIYDPSLSSGAIQPVCQQAMRASGLRTPLTHADVDLPLTVVKISGKDATRRHLANLGLTEGAQVTVLQRTPANLILDIKGSRLGVDMDLAKRVTVIA